MNKNRELFDRAEKLVPADNDSSRYRDLVVEKLAALVEVDTEEERRLQRAKAIFESMTKPRHNADGRQLALPGLNEPCDYDPDSLILGPDNKKYVRESKANGKYLAADFERSAKHSEETSRMMRIKGRKLALYNAWAFDEQAKGRPVLDLTWENCIAETGLELPVDKRDAA